MTEVEISISKTVPTTRIEKAVESACKLTGLTISSRTSLAGYPGSIHWHIKRGKEKGTLELTTWPLNRQLWANIQSGRKAEWIDRELPQLAKTIQRIIRSK